MSPQGLEALEVMTPLDVDALVQFDPLYSSHWVALLRTGQ